MNASNILFLSNYRLNTSRSIGLLRVILSAIWHIATSMSSSRSTQMPSTPPSILSSSNYVSAICDARSIIWSTVSEMSWSTKTVRTNVLLTIVFSLPIIEIYWTSCYSDDYDQSSLIIFFIHEKWKNDNIMLEKVLQMIYAILETSLVI